VAPLPSKNARFKKIVREYQRPVFRQVHRTLGDFREAQEVTQNIFLNVYYGLDEFKERSQLHTWIFRIATNACISYRRKAPREFISLEEAESDQEFVDPDPNPEELFIRIDEQARFDDLIPSLPPKEASAITLWFYDNKSYDEIANIMKVPSGTVAILLHRGKRHLHRLLVGQMKEADAK